jgi:hypothetical protein
MRAIVVILVLLVPGLAASQATATGGKDVRTPAQRKIDSQLLQEIAHVKSAPNEDPKNGVKLDRRQRALVDVRVEVTPAIQRSLRRVGASIVSSSREYHSVVAWVPLLRLEELAAEESVRAIAPVSEATIHR